METSESHTPEEVENQPTAGQGSEATISEADRIDHITRLKFAKGKALAPRPGCYYLRYYPETPIDHVSYFEGTIRISPNIMNCSPATDFSLKHWEVIDQNEFASTAKRILNGAAIKQLREILDGAAIKQVRKILDGAAIKQLKGFLDESVIEILWESLTESAIKQVTGIRDKSGIKELWESLTESAIKQVTGIRDKSGIKKLRESLNKSEIKKLKKILNDSEIEKFWESLDISAIKKLKEILTEPAIGKLRRILNDSEIEKLWKSLPEPKDTKKSPEEHETREMRVASLTKKAVNEINDIFRDPELRKILTETIVDPIIQNQKNHVHNPLSNISEERFHRLAIESAFHGNVSPHPTHRLRASGDLYVREHQLKDVVDKAILKSRSVSHTISTLLKMVRNTINLDRIPIFPRDHYRYYLKPAAVLHGSPVPGSFTIKFKIQTFDHVSNSFTGEGERTFELFEPMDAEKGKIEDELKDLTIQRGKSSSSSEDDKESNGSKDNFPALLKDQSKDFFGNTYPGFVYDKNRRVVGRILIKRVSNEFLRSADLQIDIKGSKDEETFPGGDSKMMPWKKVFRSVDWEISESQNNTDSTKIDDEKRTWTTGELHDAMIDHKGGDKSESRLAQKVFTADSVEDSGLDKRWIYHLMCVPRIRNYNRGVMYDIGAADKNKSPREGAAIAWDYRFPDSGHFVSFAVDYYGTRHNSPPNPSLSIIPEKKLSASIPSSIGIRITEQIPAESRPKRETNSNHEVVASFSIKIIRFQPNEKGTDEVLVHDLAKDTALSPLFKRIIPELTPTILAVRDSVFGPNRTADYDLELTTGKPQEEGKSLVAIAMYPDNTKGKTTTASKLHIKIFDSSSTVIIDKEEDNLWKGLDLDALKGLIKPYPKGKKSQWAADEKKKIIYHAALISGLASPTGFADAQEARFLIDTILRFAAMPETTRNGYERKVFASIPKLANTALNSDAFALKNLDPNGSKFKSHLYFRTAVHEVGHLMGLGHNFRSHGFMNTTDVIARNWPMLRTLKKREELRTLSRLYEHNKTFQEKNPAAWDPKKRVTDGVTTHGTTLRKADKIVKEVHTRNLESEIATVRREYQALINGVTDFPDNVVLEFDPLDADVLRHGPDVLVRPGTQLENPQNNKNRTRTIQARGLELSIVPIRASFPYGAPVRIEIELKNTTDQSLEPKELLAPESLSFKTGGLRGWVITPEGQVIAFEPIAIHDDELNTIQTLAPGGAIQHSATLITGSDEALFTDPGKYSVHLTAEWEITSEKFLETGIVNKYRVTGSAQVQVEIPEDSLQLKTAERLFGNPEALRILVFRGATDNTKAVLDELRSVPVLASHYDILNVKRNYDSFTNPKPSENAAESREASLEKAMKAVTSDTVTTRSEMREIRQIQTDYLLLNPGKAAEVDIPKNDSLSITITDGLTFEHDPTLTNGWYHPTPTIMNGSYGYPIVNFPTESLSI